MEQIKWLLLSYQVPTEPSKARVYVWRKLKEVGAIYYRQGVAMLPRTQRNIASFKLLSDKIEGMNGTASLAELKFFSKQDDQKAISEFIMQSRTEYKIIISEIAKLYSKKPQSKDERIVIEEKAARLEKRLNKVVSRDYFMSHKEPDMINNFNQLIKDISEIRGNIGKYLSLILNEASI